MNNDFTCGSIPKKMILFMIPILGSLILQAMYGAVDLMVVGQFGTTSGLSGISTGSNIMNFATFVVSGLAMAVTVLISRYIGMDRKDKLGKLIGATIALFSTIAIIITIALIIFARPLAVLMQAPEEALDLTVQYVRICGGGFLLITAYNTISAVFRGLGDSKSPLLFVLIACIVNIIGDLVLVAGFHMNVAGAAIATVAAQGVSVILSFWIMTKQNLPFKLKKTDIHFNEEVKGIIQIGSPIATQELLTQMSFLALCAFVNTLGLAASSGYGVASKVQSFVMLIPSALMQSMASFVSQNVGANKEKRAFKSMLTGMAIGGFIGIFVFLGVIFFGDKISMCFTSDQAVIEKAFEYLKGFALEAIVTSILFSFMGYYNGHSKTFWVMVQGLAQTFLIRLPMAYIMSIQPNASLTYIGLAAPCATIFGIILNIIYYFFFRKTLPHTEE
jgi:putative MATE family efflux protein